MLLDGDSNARLARSHSAGNRTWGDGFRLANLLTEDSFVSPITWSKGFGKVGRGLIDEELRRNRFVRRSQCSSDISRVHRSLRL